MFGIKILPMHFGRGLFCCCNFIFFYIDDKEKTNLTVRSSHSNILFLKIYKYYSIITSSNIISFIRNCYKRSEKASVLLKNFSW